ncbi:MAG: maltodextrin glucosidase [Chloroflexi bacterium]|nr:MAG: maltodextrin glucosidase [Chloroflexota bacterium]
MKNPAWLQSIYHGGSANYISKLYPRMCESVQVKIRVASGAPVTAVYLRTFPDGEQALTPMQLAETNDVSQWWQGMLLIREPVVNYRFLLVSDAGVWAYTADGATENVPLDATDFRILAGYVAPEWVKTAVFYQIFPDRFANGDPTTNPRPDDFEFRGYHPQTYEWEQSPPVDQPFPIVFYGGDLPGIVGKLDYLQGLGINAVYLNPVFTAHSNHKYDVVDYNSVDPHFGGDESLAVLREALTQRTMHTILDIVPNHCGYWHHWFQAAQLDANAPEADFFTFTNHPDEFESWLGVWMLPKLNYQSEELRRRIYEGVNAVFRRWMRPPFAIDGWRVDVANMLGRQGDIQIGTEVTRGIRQAVKETRSDAYLMGENFFDGTQQLQGDQWDGIMNYAGFSSPLAYWLTGFEVGAHGLKEKIESLVTWPTTALAATWQQYLAAVPWQIALQQFNLLDSHDVPRIRSLLHENDALHRLAAIVQFTFPGAPCVYYGDEIGMVDDPILRQRGCMIWDESRWNDDLLAFYKKLIKLRRETAVLHQGSFQILAVEPDTIVYQREGENGRVLVIAHRGEIPRTAAPLPVVHGNIPDGAQFVEYFTGHTLTVSNGCLPLADFGQGAGLFIQQI